MCKVLTYRITLLIRAEVIKQAPGPLKRVSAFDTICMSLNPYLARLYFILGIQSADYSYQELMAVNNSRGLYDDIYVVHYDFSTIDHAKAIEEFQILVQDLYSASLEICVKLGPDKSLLLMVKSPKDLLGKAVYKSRVKDWLYGVTQQRPEGNKNTSVRGETETENLRSMFHLVTWNQKLGGAGITPGIGKWENVKSVYPLHNNVATRAFLLKWSRQIILKEEDLDQIRGLFGEKVAFYFAFVQTYIIALAFPSASGILAWFFLPDYSLTYAIITCLWCTTFLEYWKLKEVDLSLRWSVKGVGSLKVNRARFNYDKEIIDPITGETVQHFSHWKRITRQLLQLPFALIVLASLGTLISFVFVIEILSAKCTMVHSNSI